MRRAVIAVVLIATCILGLRFGMTGSGASEKSMTAPTAIAPTRAEEEQPDACVPLRFIVIVDKTASMRGSGTPDLALADMEPAFEDVAKCGGELAVGVLGVASDRPLHRVRIPVPPARPIFGPESPNPFIRKRQATERKAILAAYDDSVERRAALVEGLLGEFATAVEPLLTLPAVQRSTDVAGAVRRASLWLGEPASFSAARSCALFVTDGIDTVGGKFNGLPPGTTVAVVNGTSNLGALKRLSPVPDLFDSPAPAVAHLVAADRKAR